MPAHRHPSWAIYPLQRQQPHDGLSVVNQPDGYGLHLWLETDTHQPGRCSPPLGGASGPTVQRQRQRALRSQQEQLCKARAPRASFVWLPPPTAPTELKVEPFPLLEEPDLLSDPNAVLEQEERFLGNSAEPPGQAP